MARRVRRDLQYAVIAGMLVSGAYVVLSGLIADLWGVHQFALHRFAGYACAALIVTHLALNWARVTAYFARWVGKQRRSSGQMERRIPPSGRRGFLLAALAGVGGFFVGRLIPDSRGSPDADLGQLYHQWSKPSGASLAGLMLDWGTPAQPVKSYPDAARIPMSIPRDYGELGVGEAIAMRRSRREYVPGPLELGELSALLHAASGVTELSRGFRAAPSAGALYPIETYVAVHDVAGLDPGLYHYAVADHALEQLRVDDLRTQMVVAGIGQEMLGRAQVCFILSAVFGRTRPKYRERTYRYVMLEAGHIGQNLYLAATSMGLGACAIGAFLDDVLNGLLDVDGEDEAAVYVLTVGKMA